MKWKSQVSTFTQRTTTSAAADPAASIVLPIFNNRILSILSYIGQLKPLGTGVVPELRERYWLHKLLHLTPGTLPDAARANLAEVGLPNVPILKILMLATQYRTAIKTIPNELCISRHVVVGSLRLASSLS